ncbi:hypothetical protein V6N13_045495 [Hibiscus sabdariffa]
MVSWSEGTMQIQVLRRKFPGFFTRIYIQQACTAPSINSTMASLSAEHVNSNELLLNVGLLGRQTWILIWQAKLCSKGFLETLVTGKREKERNGVEKKK